MVRQAKQGRWQSLPIIVRLCKLLNLSFLVCKMGTVEYLCHRVVAGMKQDDAHKALTALPGAH